MAEWLGIGLQNQVQQFKSAWHLSKSLKKISSGIFFCAVFDIYWKVYNFTVL